MSDRGRFYENPRSEASRKKKSSTFAVVCLLIASLAVVILVTLIGSIVSSGGNWLSWELLTGVHREDNPEGSGIGQAIIGSLALCLICGLVALPVGIGTALFLEEFKPTNRFIGWLHGLVQLNINNLAGVPSIVYGILGLTAFVYMFGLIEPIQANNPPSIEIGAEYFYQTKTLGGKWVNFPAEDPEQTVIKIYEPVDVTMPSGEIVTLNVLPKSADSPTDDAVRDISVFEGANASTFRRNTPLHFHLPFSKSILSAGLTLALVILPIVIIASQEALRAVPDSLREASLGLGATRWQTVRGTVLPAAVPGIMTGAILSMSRAVGEAAPIIAVMGSVAGTTTGLTSLMDKSPVLPVMIFRWAGEENPGFEHLSAAAIIVLLVLLLIMNSIAILIRYRHEKKQS